MHVINPQKVTSHPLAQATLWCCFSSFRVLALLLQFEKMRLSLLPVLTSSPNTRCGVFIWVATPMFQENAAVSVRAFSTSMLQSCGDVTVCAQSNQCSEHKRSIKWRSECREGGLNTRFDWRTCDSDKEVQNNRWVDYVLFVNKGLISLQKTPESIDHLYWSPASVVVNSHVWKADLKNSISSLV